MSLGEVNYKSDYDVNFETGARITNFDVNTSASSFDFKVDPKDDEGSHMKLTVKETTVQKTVLQVETSTKESSDKVVEWFKEKSFSAPALSREMDTDWPPQMRFAFTPTISISVSEGDEVHTFNWPGLTLGIDTKGTHKTWWLSSPFIKTKEALSILGIHILDDVIQEVKIQNSDREDRYCRLFVKVDGSYHFKLKAEIHKKSIFDI